MFAGAVLLIGCSSGGGAASAGPSTREPSVGEASTAASAATVPADATGEPGAGSPEPAGGGATGQPVTDAGQLASLLGPGDFSAVGVGGAGTPTVNNPEPGSAYIVYAGLSSGTGGIELDVAVGQDSTEMAGVFAAMAAPFLDFEGKGKASLPMADDAQLRTDNPIDGGGTWAGVAVQKGRLVFVLGIPSSPDAEAQLVSLAKLVLERAAGLE
jgi:hypothetical protein